MTRRFGPLIFFLLLAFLTAGFGSRYLPGAWYALLTKPSWNPPNWIFGPVWTLLYTLMGVAAWRVYRVTRHERGVNVPILLWLLQLIPNALWSYFFFGAHRMDWALMDIVVMLCLISSTGALFYRVDRLAGLMFVPYFLWVSFATVLNWHLLMLNPLA